MTRAARARKQLGIPEPVVSFKIWPETWRPSFYFTVKIFRTRGQMRRYLKFIRPERKFEKTWAFTDQKSQEAIFCLWTCRDNTVAHETHHIVNWWALKKRFIRARCIEWDSPTHERMAEAHGNMVSQFWSSFVKAGLKRSECWGMEKGETK